MKLNFVDVQPEDMGNFSCTVRREGRAESKTFVPMRVLGKGYWLIGLRSQ